MDTLIISKTTSLVWYCMIHNILLCNFNIKHSKRTEDIKFCTDKKLLLTSRLCLKNESGTTGMEYPSIGSDQSRLMFEQSDSVE